MKMLRKVKKQLLNRCFWAWMVVFCLTACAMSDYESGLSGGDLVLLTSDKIYFSGEGGTDEILYLWRGGDGSDLSAYSTASWISVLDTDTYGKVVFAVDENLVMQSRTGEIRLKAGDTLVATVSIFQGKMAPWVADTICGGYYGLVDSLVYRYQLSMESRDCSYHLDVYSKKVPENASLMLPIGTYRLDLESTHAAGTVAYASSCCQKMDASGVPLEPIPFVQLQMVVKEGELVLEALDEEGSWHHVLYEGSYTLEDRTDVPENPVWSTLEGDYEVKVEGVVVELEYYGDYYGNGLGNWFLKIRPETGTGDAVQVDFWVPDIAFEADLSGTYTALDTIGPMMFLPGMYVNDFHLGSWYLELEGGKTSGRQAPLVAGSEMSIVRDEENDTYTIRIRAMDDAEEAHGIRMEWTGTLEKKLMI